MPKTAWKHFCEDIGRAESLVKLSRTLEKAGAGERRYQDVRLSAIAMAVGALDAYLCDAYVDCLSAVLRTYVQRKWGGSLPAFYAKQPLPAGEVLDSSREIRPLWAVRMAARAVMERDNMLAIARIDDYFNGVLPPNQKLWLAVVPAVLGHSRKKLTGPMSAGQINGLAGDAKVQAAKKVVSAMKKRLGETIQIRHDWIHNCGRPKAALQKKTFRHAQDRIREIEVFITEIEEHIESYRLA